MNEVGRGTNTVGRGVSRATDVGGEEREVMGGVRGAWGMGGRWGGRECGRGSGVKEVGRGCAWRGLMCD